MGTSLEAWCAATPPEFHRYHPQHPEYDGPKADAAPAPKARASKYGNRITEYAGVKYHSKAEATRAERLDWMKRVGLIAGWRRQPRYTLGVPENLYIGDFEVTNNDGSVHTEDVKGAITPKFARDKRLWRAYGPHPLYVLRNGKTVEIVTPREGQG